MFKEWWYHITGRNELNIALNELQQKQLKMLEYLILIEAEITAFTTDELDPKRKAASDKLSRMIEKKVIAEDLARRHTLGEF